MISFDLVSDPSIKIVDLKRDIKRALLEADGGSQRYYFLQEKSYFTNSLTVRDRVHDINIRIFFDKQIEVMTSNLMKQYFEMDERLKKIVIFFKNWIPEETRDQ